MKKWEIVIITGMSGAGKTLTIDYFEDQGYFCIDNIPAQLLGSFITLYQKSKIEEKKLAFIVDVRSFSTADEFLKEIQQFHSQNMHVKLLYLECKIEELIKRYTLTRRKHPIKEEENLLGKIELEKQRLRPIRDIADIIIDTSDLKPKEFVSKLNSYFSTEDNTKLTVTFTSFGFKNGVPLDLDMMFDLRFLPNPYYLPELKTKTGHTEAVQDYVMSFNESQIMFQKLVDLFEFMLPLVEKEGKAYLNIGIGCSGGRHRSVTFVQKLFGYFSDNSKYKLKFMDRDITKD